MKTKTFLPIFIMFVFSFFASASLFAQEEETKSNIKYSNITEFGFFATSPNSIFAEGTTVHGISIKNQHCIGLGIGFGGGAYFPSYSYLGTIYMPVFANYRLRFLPDRKLSPHVNLALGGIMLEESWGAYSSLTAGFKAGHFSFSSGFSCLAVWEGGEFFLPMGITIKCGFSF